MVIVADAGNFIQNPADIADQDQIHEQQTFPCRILHADRFKKSKRPTGAETDQHHSLVHIKIMHGAS